LSNSRKLLRSKFFWVAVLYFSEGFPFGIFFDVLPVYFRRQGVNLADIGALSLLGLAWTLKFLWAPAIDHYRGHRLWMAGCDLAMGAILLAFAAAAGFGPWMWAAIGFFTVLSATNDIAIDGYTIEILNRDEMGLANGIRIGFYRVGMLGAGAVLVLPDWVGWSNAFACAAVALALSAGAMLLAPREQPRPRAAPQVRDTWARVLAQPLLAAGLACFAAFVAALIVIEYQRPRLDGGTVRAMGMATVLLLGASAVLLRAAARRQPAAIDTSDPVLGGLLELFARRGILPVLLFVLIFKLGDASMGFMVKPFWSDAGFSLTEIGLVSVNIGLGLSIAGGLAGGWYADRVGIFRALWVLGLYQALSNLGYAAVAAALPAGGEILLWQRAAMYAASATESFTGGLGTAAFLAFLMAIVDKRHSAAEYALLSSVFALSRSVAGWGSGFGAQELGYSGYFLLTFFLSFPAYALLPWVKEALARSDERSAQSSQ
jgi:PAT family beta-lactamase induction signal transducer AmpG